MLACYNVVFIHNLVAKSHACNARVPYSSLNGVCVCVVRVRHKVKTNNGKSCRKTFGQF